MQKKGSNIISQIFSVTVIIVFAKLLGFVKQVLTAAVFGAGIETDVVNLAQNLFGNLDYLITQVFITSFVPVYIRVKTAGEEKGSLFASRTLKIWLSFSFLIGLGIFAVSPWVARLVAPSYDNALLNQLSVYIRILCPSVMIVISGVIFNSILRAGGHFNQGEFSSVIQSIVIISMSLIFGRAYGPVVLLVAFYVYEILNLFFLGVFSRREWRFQPHTGTWFDENVKEQFKMTGPLFFGYAMIFINQQVDAIIVSGLGAGAVTALGYAAVLNNLIGTLVGSISSVLFTYISKDVAEKKDEHAAVLIKKGALLFTTILVPICIIMIFCSKDIITIIFGHGKFTEEAIEYAATALCGYSFSVIALGYRELFSRFQYSYLDSRQPMINSTIGIVFNIVFSIILSKFWGIFGVTIASSMSTIICGCLNTILARRHNKYLGKLTGSGNLLRWLTGGVVCVIIAVGSQKFLSGWNIIVRLLFILIVSTGAYMVICLPLVKKGIALMHSMRKNE